MITQSPSYGTNSNLKQLLTQIRCSSQHFVRSISARKRGSTQDSLTSPYGTLCGRRRRSWYQLNQSVLRGLLLLFQRVFRASLLAADIGGQPCDRDKNRDRQLHKLYGRLLQSRPLPQGPQRTAHLQPSISMVPGSLAEPQAVAAARICPL